MITTHYFKNSKFIVESRVTWYWFQVGCGNIAHCKNLFLLQLICHSQNYVAIHVIWKFIVQLISAEKILSLLHILPNQIRKIIRYPTTYNQARSQDLKKGGAILKEWEVCIRRWLEFSLTLNQFQTVCPKFETKCLGNIGNSKIFSAQN